jgi:hypothetical protein
MVENPFYRRETIASLETIAGLKQGESRAHDEGYYHIAMHTLLDDTALYDNPSGEIGWILVNEEEAKAIGKLTQLIMVLYAKIGNNLTSEKYRQHPDWPSIKQAAKLALEIMIKSEKQE